MADLQQIYSDVNTNPLASPGLPGALNTSMQPNIAPVKKALPPVSTNPTPSNNVIPSTENLVSEEMKIGSQLTTANENLAKATAAQADAQAEGKAQVIQEYADKTHEAVDQKAKQLAKWEYPEMHPTETNIKELGGLFSVMSVIGLMLGGSGKLGAMNALGAMSGMMKGWQEGKQDLFKREKEKFDARFAEVKQIHADIENNFNEYMKLLSTDKEAAMYAREELVRKTGSSGILSAQIEKGKLEAAAATIKSIKTSIEHIEKRIDDRRKEANAERRFNLEYEQRERLAQARLGKIPAEVRNEVNDHYPHLNPESLANLGQEGAKRVIGGLNTIAQIENVANFIKQNPEAVGGMAKLKNFINLDAIKSITGDDPASAEAKSAVIDRQIDDAIKQKKITPDEARSAKVLSKLLFAVAISDVQSSGQRGSIYLDKQYQTIYDQASRLPTLMNVLHERIGESNRNLTRVHMGIADRDDVQNYPLTLNGSEKWVNENFPTYSTQQIDSAVQSGKLKNNSYFTTTDGKIHRIEIQGKNYYVR